VGVSHPSFLQALSDDDVLHGLAQLVAQSRRDEAALVAHLAEFDARRLYARFASPSLFAYCTEILRCSEAEAFLRIAAARASRKHPVLLEMLGDGRLHLSGIERLAPHLDGPNRDELLVRAAGRTKRQIEELVAELAPRPDAPERIRKLPGPRRLLAEPAEPTAASTAAPGAVPASDDGGRPAARPPSLALRPDGVARPLAATAASRLPEEPRAERVVPLSPDRYKVQFTASATLRDKLERLQAMMRDAQQDARLEAVIEAAVEEKLARLEARRRGATNKPRSTAPSTDGQPPSGRYIPLAIRRVVWARDGGRCRFVDEDGRRCTARRGLEIHHVHPFAMGGGHNDRNLRLYCGTHNRHVAEIDYGRRAGRPTSPDGGAGAPARWASGRGRGCGNCWEPRQSPMFRFGHEGSRTRSMTERAEDGQPRRQGRRGGRPRDPREERPRRRPPWSRYCFLREAARREPGSGSW
jgi:hypothetical protein